jgi:hypothetical protein
MSSHLRDLPPRLTTPEVCALGRFSLRTFQRRRRSGKFLVAPIDRNIDGLIFPRDAVLRALDLIPNDPAPQAQPEAPRVSTDKIREARSRTVRGGAPTSGRDASGAVRGAGAQPAIRLAFDATAPNGRPPR